MKASAIGARRLSRPAGSSNTNGGRHKRPAYVWLRLTPGQLRRLEPALGLLQRGVLMYPEKTLSELTMRPSFSEGLQHPSTCSHDASAAMVVDPQFGSPPTTQMCLNCGGVLAGEIESRLALGLLWDRYGWHAEIAARLHALAQRL